MPLNARCSEAWTRAGLKASSRLPSAAAVEGHRREQALVVATGGANFGQHLGTIHQLVERRHDRVAIDKDAHRFAPNHPMLGRFGARV